MNKAKTSRLEAHMRAPKCAQFVAKLRQKFGADQVKVLWVQEGDFYIGPTTKGEKHDAV